MTIQDIQNILTVSRWGSINKAAEQIPMTQPALSRCIQKVEREFQVHLFRRKQGSQLSLTKEGEAFIHMGEKMLEAYGEFERTVERERAGDHFSIHLGLPPQMSYSISEALLQGMHEKAPQCRVYLHPLRNDLLETGLENGSLDFAILRRVESKEMEDRFHFAPVNRGSIELALRSGSRAGEKAYPGTESALEILDLTHLRGERFVANLPGSNSWDYSRQILEKAGIPVNLIEMANFNNRMDMVRRGEANCLVLPGISLLSHYSQLNFYALPQEQTVTVVTGLACKKGQEKKRYFQLLLSCLQEALS